MMNKKSYIVLLLLLTPIIRLNGQIIVTFNGMPSFNTTSLSVSEAGNDFPASITELQATTTINIQNNSASNPNNYNYRLEASLLESIGTLGLTIERTGNGSARTGGSAQGKISGGTPAILLSTTPVYFFEGSGDRFNVLVRFGLRNLSVVQPAGKVTFSLIFTATEY